jgi:hypothetical protein
MTPEQAASEIRQNRSLWRRLEPLPCECREKLLAVTYVNEQTRERRVMVPSANKGQRAFAVDATQVVTDVAECPRCHRAVLLAIGDGNVGVLRLDPPTHGQVAE